MGWTDLTVERDRCREFYQQVVWARRRPSNMGDHRILMHPAGESDPHGIATRSAERVAPVWIITITVADLVRGTPVPRTWKIVKGRSDGLFTTLLRHQIGGRNGRLFENAKVPVKEGTIVSECCDPGWPVRWRCLPPSTSFQRKDLSGWETHPAP